MSFERTVRRNVPSAGHLWSPRRARTERPILTKFRTFATVDANGSAIMRVNAPRPGHPATISRLVAAVPIPSVQLLFDTFSRTIASPGWGTPNVGPAWAIRENTVNTIDVNGTIGRLIEVTSTGLAHVASPIASADVNFSGIMPTIVTNAARGGGLSARVQAATNEGYWLEVDGTDVVLRKGLGTGGATVLSTVAKALVAPVQMRLECIGTVIRGKAWTGAEPAASDVQSIDSDYANGGVGAWGNLDVGVAGTATFDSFEVTGSSITPTWNAYTNAVALENIIDSSSVPIARWVPSLVNGHRLEYGDTLFIEAAGGTPGTQAVVSAQMYVE